MLGRSILGAAPRVYAADRIHCVTWNEIKQNSKWKSRLPRSDADLVFANGLTHPGLDPRELLRSNYEFPLALFAEWSDRPYRFLTFGTVLETFRPIVETNPYVGSKYLLGLRVLGLNDPRRYLHLRLHTLYGENPPPHLFLGQMQKAIVSGHDFSMSPGNQLREYHRASDIADMVLAFLARSWPLHSGETSIQTLSHGNPLRLKDIATGVFQNLGIENQLRIGALPAPKYDNSDRLFLPAHPDLAPPLRDVSADIAALISSERRKTQQRIA